MKKIIAFLFLCAFYFSPTCYACPSDLLKQAENVTLVKKMFSEFAEKLDMSKLDTYYTKTFVLESNGENFSYPEYKNLEQKIYPTLKSLKVTKYQDIFGAGNKVVSRMSIKLTYKDGATKEFQVFLVALIKENKIDRIWELTYPNWQRK